VPGGVRASAAATITAGCLLSLSAQLQGKPWLRLALLAATVTLQLALALLLLASLLRQAQGLLLLCVAGLLTLSMLQRLLAVLVQPDPHSILTNAAGLHRQLQRLLCCSLEPLGVPHSRWTLTFDDAKLEDRYRKVRDMLRARHGWFAECCCGPASTLTVADRHWHPGVQRCTVLYYSCNGSIWPS
jgi:hypothetical protein